MIYVQLNEQLMALHTLLGKLTDHAYENKISMLGDVSIGQHTRHIIELLQCALSGYDTGLVDYQNRQRNLRYETDRLFAQAEIDGMMRFTDRPDRRLVLSDHMLNGDRVSTTYCREIVYNTEHIIHHLALIKVALRALNLDIVDANFGMAYATISYQAQCAQ